jgi:transcriptional regulator with XRE-family HTH domain
MDKLVWETAEELDKELAKRVRNIRKRRSISQERLAAMSGVSYASIKRFESTGQISLVSLTKLAMALNLDDELRELFTQVSYQSIEEVIRESR